MSGREDICIAIMSFVFHVYSSWRFDFKDVMGSLQ